MAHYQVNGSTAKLQRVSPSSEAKVLALPIRVEGNHDV
jgi:hypothetical protein